MNVDGSTHDKLQGEPRPNAETREWLWKHGWNVYKKPIIAGLKAPGEYEVIDHIKDNL